MNTQDETWREHAACRGKLDLFMPVFTEQRVVTEERHAKAVVICQRCPVKQECLEYALGNSEKMGVWGGTTPRQRRRMLAKERIA